MVARIALRVKCASHKNKYPSSIGYNRNSPPNAADPPFRRERTRARARIIHRSVNAKRFLRHRRAPFKSRINYTLGKILTSCSEKGARGKVFDTLLFASLVVARSHFSERVVNPLDAHLNTHKVSCRRDFLVFFPFS